MQKYPANDDSPPPSSKHGNAEPEQVWLVEDDQTFRNALARVINYADGLCCSGDFRNCEDALAALKHKPAPKVLLLDIGLPGMSGLEGIRLFRAKIPNLQIIILTAFDEQDKVVQAVCSGAVGYLLKGASRTRVVESIREVLAGGAPINAQIARRVLEVFARLAPKKQDYELTEREQQILELLVAGHMVKEIAVKTELSYHTVDSHVRHIYEKLHVNSRAAVVAKALQDGLV
jgi:DNA-binding NarL/FixJ family response regulator